MTTLALIASLLLGQAQDRKAPELEGGLGWLNTDKPIKLADLKGKVVLLDFWTFCCINCMHVLPDLAKLEKKYPNELVVIGVHSAKFENEKQSECIKEAILKYDIEHPVVNDAEFKLFRAYGARGWPHFTLIDPAGDIVGHASGEGNYDVFVAAIDATLKKFEGKINKTPMKFALEKDKVKAGALSFPGKILATADRLFIADTKHHRVLVTDAAGKVLEVVGGKEEGFQDGDFGRARFDEPQGMALKGTTLYVCDRQNHSIRAIDLAGKKVSTLAGTGKQGHDRKGGAAKEVALNSPWDVAIDGDRLFVAMAGHHQIWVVDLAKNRIEPFSGTGREHIKDGPHEVSEFSQPSGLSLRGGKVYVADSEISAVREVDLDPKGVVRTIVGVGLFDFGDKDGKGDEVRLQHALGVQWHDGKLYIADSYNHRIKVCDPATREVKAFVGDGKRGKEDGAAARFSEPGGLAAWGDKLYVADTNNHAIRVINLKTREVSTLPVEQR
jgi:DNA-binding beta-propeller fold protein YncE